MIYDTTSNSLYQRRPLPPQTFQLSEKLKLEVNYVFFPQRLKSQHNYSLISFFKMAFKITGIHVNST